MSSVSLGSCSRVASCKSEDISEYIGYPNRKPSMFRRNAASLPGMAICFLILSARVASIFSASAESILGNVES